MDDVMDETFGLGPLETLLKDPGITDILINRYDRIYVEKSGRLERAEVVAQPLAVGRPPTLRRGDQLRLQRRAVADGQSQGPHRRRVRNQ